MSRRGSKNGKDQQNEPAAVTSASNSQETLNKTNELAAAASTPSIATSSNFLQLPVNKSQECLINKSSLNTSMLGTSSSNQNSSVAIIEVQTDSTAATDISMNGSQNRFLTFKNSKNNGSQQANQIEQINQSKPVGYSTPRRFQKTVTFEDEEISAGAGTDTASMMSCSAITTYSKISKKSLADKFEQITYSMRHIKTDKEFEFLGISRRALEKINKPLAECLQKYILHLKCANPAQQESFSSVKFYQAQTYNIIADSMEQLDENKKGDWVIMQMYI